MANGTNTYLAQEKSGIVSVGDYATPTTCEGVLDVLIAMLTPEHTTVFRQYLDEMSPMARNSLLVELDAMKARMAVIETP